jgi:hypothetical protein
MLNCENPVVSYVGHGRNSVKGQNGLERARSRTGSDVCERGHVSEPLEQAQSTADTTCANLKMRTAPSMTTIPEDDIPAEIEKHLRKSGAPGLDMLKAFRDASIQIPINPDSLAGLDIPRIVNNPKLRNDVNLDRDVHLRPNLGGVKGKHRTRLADDYWEALEAELYILDLVRRMKAQSEEKGRSRYRGALLRESRKRLPSIFEAVRDILTTLVPYHDQANIIKRLDIDLLVQQIDNGIYNLVDLANWLEKVLKSHGAPMRMGSWTRCERASPKACSRSTKSS